MQAEFRPPHRRNRVSEQYEAPLPVSSSPGENYHFRAHLINRQVVLFHPEHIRRIHSQGYFGKGVLSRAKPDHCFADQWQQHQGVSLPVVSLARYKELLQWAGAALTAQGLDEQAVNQTLVDLQQPVEMEEVKREMGDRARPGEEPGSMEALEEEEEEEDLPAKKRFWYSEGSDVSLLPQSALCDLRLSQDCDPYWDQDSDQDTELGREPSVPGPGFVLVAFQVEGCVAEVRRTPLAITEYLQLSLEEAFFLVYSLGCLSIYLHQEPLPLVQLWNTFRTLQPNFISSFAAYQHFRAKGWVPKGGGGAKYGVDFSKTRPPIDPMQPWPQWVKGHVTSLGLFFTVLYRKGPPFYHGSYSVVVQQVDSAFRGSELRPFSWRSLAALSRITANVSKELMLCYIIYPSKLSQTELDSPECLIGLEVQEVIVSRWVSSKERAEQEDI